MIRRHENPVAIRAGALSLLVHVVLLTLLLVSFNWKSVKPMSVAEVELWDSVPVVKPQPLPPPPAPEPEPPKPEPVVKEEPKPEPPPEPKAEIEVKKKPVEAPKKVEPKKKEEKPKPDPKIEEAKKKRLQEEQLKRLQQELLAEDAKPTQQEARKEGAPGPKTDVSVASLGEMEKYIGLISGKIRRNVNKQLCGNGKPELRLVISLMPTGEVIGTPKLVKGSGIAACDEAVERAILQSQPLPVPTQPDLFARFRDLNLTFKPNDE